LHLECRARHRRRVHRGFIFTSIGGQGITGFNVYSMFVAIIGAIVVLLLYHALTGRRRLP
jgi:uncharacterized membrane protein YeaQ/YmgE (transglycosylase-associated protein family)